MAHSGSLHVIHKVVSLTSTNDDLHESKPECCGPATPVKRQREEDCIETPQHQIKRVATPPPAPRKEQSAARRRGLGHLCRDVYQHIFRFLDVDSRWQFMWTSSKLRCYIEDSLAPYHATCRWCLKRILMVGEQDIPPHKCKHGMWLTMGGADGKPMTRFVRAPQNIRKTMGIDLVNVVEDLLLEDSPFVDLDRRLTLITAMDVPWIGFKEGLLKNPRYLTLLTESGTLYPAAHLKNIAELEK
eukprot:Sspe_Gene.57828::Locus_31728_Transcript_1_1_Confidence_1.000_Length_999::g.57828::m.57828